MGIISTHENKITLIYNAETSLGKQTLGYVNAAEKDVLTIDTSKTNIPGTQWIEITDNLGISIASLINKQHPNFAATYDENVDLERHDWLKVIDKHPETVEQPILIIGENFYQLKSPSDFVKFMESDSAGVSRNPAKKKEK
ncbi:hypothetical protein J8281_00970 [Aquimarina sp. U1-2]|uniref:arsenate reductase family protein n=1 Tax=Aquimarina sp. U1-2 TaxID=2823141 RepID=UPI001AECE398|nr:hypothetical protein [Aquimarina sp. U1-2]MBP2830743.1 hypothetical protein [Aquimarina sp. U1-2]